jgi:hypothetical protein
MNTLGQDVLPAGWVSSPASSGMGVVEIKKEGYYEKFPIGTDFTYILISLNIPSLTPEMCKWIN